MMIAMIADINPTMRSVESASPPAAATATGMSAASDPAMLATMEIRPCANPW